jgi:type II secretory pathway component GspD/PulD (secretin)
MKNITIILIGACLFVLGYSALGQNEKYLSVSGKFDDGKWPVSKVLAIYKALAKTELIVASNVQDIHGIDLRMEEPLPRDEAARMIEQALLKQAGIVITHLDGKKTSVTYNDKLELQTMPLKSQEPTPVGRNSPLSLNTGILRDCLFPRSGAISEPVGSPTGSSLFSRNWSASMSFISMNTLPSSWPINI